jgi:hypothetical protein
MPQPQSQYYTTNPTQNYYSTQAQNFNHAMSYQNGNYQLHHQSNSISNTGIKLEPYDPTTQYPVRQVIDISPPMQQNQYFTNSIPFKQEPSEPVIKQEIINYNNESPSTSSNNNNENAALNIVNHLLKDQQILNQLEKVAQSFRLN